jgi:hypothetical protein
MNRRVFIVAAGRYFLLSVLLLVSGILVHKRQAHPDRCVENPFCKDCSDLDNCSLTQAKKAKGYEKR